MTRGPAAGRRHIPRTEERVFPPARRSEDGMLAEHLARYRFVGSDLVGRVLDLGCGTGYGAREIARSNGVREVVAIDRSSDALAWALRYYPDPKVHPRQADVTATGWEEGLGLFDGIVALEVIEHLGSEAPFWAAIPQLLREGGILWISTPLGRGRGEPASDPFHVHQLRRSEVAALFRDRWEPRLFGQSGAWIESWIPGRRYRTILVRARARADRTGEGEIGDA